MWTTVNRINRIGTLIGSAEQMMVCQFFEKESKGILELGKLAAMFILDQNTMKIHHIKLKEIRVIETK